jgi:hypothetical protein
MAGTFRDWAQLPLIAWTAFAKIPVTRFSASRENNTVSTVLFRPIDLTGYIDQLLHCLRSADCSYGN